MTAEGWTSWPAPAKLNLFLHVVGRRPDGYHLLQTVFQLIDLCDTVRLRPRADTAVVRVDGPVDVAVDDDLSVRAARLLQAQARGCPGVDIAVEKRIPIGGGLGGGSSDAATTLVALNCLWGLGLARARLAEIGLALGADVPVFVFGHSAWAEGVGERLRPIDLPARWFAVIDPGVEVATGPIFQASELTRNSPGITIPCFVAGVPTRNDLEAVVRARYDAVARALDWLGARADARLTGSGGCIYAAFDGRGQALQVARAVPAPWRALVAQGLQVSPLAAREVAWRQGG
jgi:4-diphosphocytidyl-2-C-methyl-D-erythritol kinase